STMKTAIVTGGCSGIGLALVQHLLEKKDETWRVVVADINVKAYEDLSSSFDQNRTIFVHTDVADWDSHLAMFKKAYEWKTEGASSQQVDFFAANAGIADRERVQQEFDLDAEPQKPNLSCVEVDLTAVLFGLKLFIHYSRKTKRDSKDTNFHPKMVITASCVGFYSFPLAPQYAAAKMGCVGLTRAVGDYLLKHDDISVNAICPGFVVTNIVPKPVVDLWPKKYVTPTSTMMRAYDELLDESGKTAQCVECSVNKLYYRKALQPPDAGQQFLVDEA
ncbi:hypothetical protein EJ08DRAFT_559282, partial [Tothia fuscella]